MTRDFQVRFFDLDAYSVSPGWLSRDETARVARKATPILRQRQGASFCVVRQTLATVLGLTPATLPLRVAEGGKPFIEGHPLQFNVSHSGGAGMLAWSHREIGADIEALIRRPSESLAAEILGPAELGRWKTTDEPHRQAWLTRAWTRKESTLKATGSGLRLSPRLVDVFGGENEGGGWLIELEGRRWRGIDLGLDDGVPADHRAAVCVEVTGD